jgi:hypothetical protein
MAATSQNHDLPKDTNLKFCTLLEGGDAND